MPPNEAREDPTELLPSLDDRIHMQGETLAKHGDYAFAIPEVPTRKRIQEHRPTITTISSVEHDGLEVFLKDSCGIPMSKLLGTKRGRPDEAHWTAGGDHSVVHHRKIDGGASGEVHEVSCNQ
jgi:hypothetical protein